jgi:hypothetical protein
MIKNQTPYKGKLKFKFEKYPEYSGSKSGILNKVHLDLGFTKLVSRMIPNNKKLDGWEVDTNKVNLIEEYTDGRITLYEWWDVRDGDNILKTHTKPDNPKDVVFYGCLPNSFVTKTGEFIGDIRRAWWYYTNEMKVCEEYPHGVAKKYEKGKLIGYYGYTHRGGCLFQIGDRLFNSNYIPKFEDYEIWEWAGWEDRFNKLYEESDELSKKWMDDDGISYVMPYTKRGPKVIETLEEALQAAINISKELS